MPRKYRNTPTHLNGQRFDSKGEARRWQDLQLLERAGQITSLRRQVSHRLEVNGTLIAFYRSDFEYVERGKHVVEDFKGVRTPEYRIKRALMKACHGIEIFETGTRRRAA